MWIIIEEWIWLTTLRYYLASTQDWIKKNWFNWIVFFKAWLNLRLTRLDCNIASNSIYIDKLARRKHYTSNATFNTSNSRLTPIDFI